MHCRKKSAVQYIMASLWPGSTFFHSTARRRRRWGWIHTCHGYWYQIRPCRDCQCWIWQRECYRWLLEHHLKKYKVRLNTDCGGKVSNLPIRNLPKILISLLSLWQEGQQSQLGGTMSCMSRIQATVTLCKCCPTVFPHSSHHMSTSPFMYFQNQNIEKEPSLKVLS